MPLAINPRSATLKKVSILPVAGDSDVQKQTNEIDMIIPLLDAIAIQGKTLAADALLTQRKIAEYLVNRKADYYFTVKNNQPTLRQDIALSSRIGKHRTSSTVPHPITAASKPAKSEQHDGAQPLPGFSPRWPTLPD
ncbi:MAG: hypothetical protein ACXWTK_00130 [Methylobacter sp.]